jgi:hypothetical protein
MGIGGVFFVSFPRTHQHVQSSLADRVSSRAGTEIHSNTTCSAGHVYYHRPGRLHEESLECLVDQRWPYHIGDEGLLKRSERDGCQRHMARMLLRMRRCIRLGGMIPRQRTYEGCIVYYVVYRKLPKKVFTPILTR